MVDKFNRPNFIVAICAPAFPMLGSHKEFSYDINFSTKTPKIEPAGSYARDAIAH
jgi:hypothetical protein